MKLQKAVLSYLSYHDTSPLVFLEDKSENIPDDLDELIIFCLERMSYNSSKNYINNRIETDPNKWRSSIDIWRHVKFYKPEITIFDVMDSLYRQQDELVGHYCITVQRQVFKLRMLNTRGGFYSDIDTEFGFEFIDWGGINK